MKKFALFVILLVISKTSQAQQLTIINKFNYDIDIRIGTSNSNGVNSLCDLAYQSQVINIPAGGVFTPTFADAQIPPNITNIAWGFVLYWDPAWINCGTNMLNCTSGYHQVGDNCHPAFTANSCIEGEPCGLFSGIKMNATWVPSPNGDVTVTFFP